MHIKYLSRPVYTRQHRLYVAVPLFTLCVALSFGSALFYGSVTADTLGQRIAVEGVGSFAQTDQGIRLESGNLVAAAHGIVRVQAGLYEILGWNGAYEATLQGGALDIAALTTPVLVRSSDTFWLIPVGMQQRITAASVVYGDDPAAWIAERKPIALPAHYLQDRLPQAERLLKSASFTDARHQVSVYSPLAGQILRLEASRERAEEELKSVHLNTLYHALLNHDAEGARSMLLTDTAEAVLSDEVSMMLMPELLVLAHRVSLQSLFVPYFVRSQDQLILALLHPSVRGHAWVLPWPDMMSDVRIAVLLALPMADHASEAIPELAVQSWGGHWNSLLMETDLPLALADAVLSPLEREIFSLEAQGYPERARRYAAVTVEAFYPRMAEFSAEARSIIERLGAFAAGGNVSTAPVTVPAPEPLETAVQDASSPVPLDAQRAVELETIVRGMLTDAGCMFTGKTVIKAVTGEKVIVDNIVIGTSKGDRIISFDYDVVSDRVVNIEKDGKILPYSLSFEQYLKWVKQG